MSFVLPTTIPNFAALDVEATGLSPWRGARMFSAAATLANGQQHFWRDGDWSGLRRLCADPTIDKVFHNAPYDLRMLEWAGIKVCGRVWDTMIFCHLLNGEDAEIGLNLGRMAVKYLPPDKRKVVDEIEAWYDENKIGKEERYEKVGFDLLPHDLLKRRNVGDTEITGALFQRTFATVRKHFPFLLEQEHRLIPVTKSMTDRGICIDEEEVEAQKANFDVMIEDVISWFEGLLGWDYFNINSRAHQMAALDCAGLLKPLEALPKHLKTEKGQVRMDDFNLRNLHHPVAAMLTMGRAAWKFRYTFLTGIQREAINGVVHASWKQLGTRTGRYSCSEPNLMNIPIEGEQGRSGHTAEEKEELFRYTGLEFGSHIKRIFVCRPGYAHVHSDKKKADYAVLAHYTNDPTLIRIMSDPDADIHSEYCKACFGEVTKGLRTRTKILLFGELYGASLNRSAKTMGATVAEAAKVRHRMNQIAPGLPKWKAGMEAEIKEKGYIVTDHGRRHYLRKDCGYQSVSRMCQGTVGDEVKSRLVAIHEWYEAEKNGCQILLMIHDDIGTEVPVEELPRAVPTIAKLMHTTSIPYNLPLHASLDVTYHRWSELTEITDVNDIPTPDRCTGVTSH